MKSPVFWFLFLLASATCVYGATQRARPNSGEAIAFAVRESARNQAHADYWRHLAIAGNQGSRDQSPDFTRAALLRTQALELAEEQFDARLEVFDSFGGGKYEPTMNPDRFSTTISNPYFPLTPGRILIYERVRHNGVERIEIQTLQQTNVIDGIECVVVREYEQWNGQVQEDTLNWFAQETSGGVWYFGEIARHYEDGFLDNLEGSWRAGKHGAQPGRIMTALPSVGQSYRQEYALGHSEDLAFVAEVNQTVNVPAGTFDDCIFVVERTPVEPDDIVGKYYAPGVGMVLEIDLTNGERLELLEIL